MPHHAISFALVHQRYRLGLFAAAAVLGACGRVAFDRGQTGDGGKSDGGGSADARVGSCPGMTGVADEDGDLVGDPCDVCPHVADPDQTNGDGDGVGDACDNEPTLGRQTLRFFDAFNGPVPEWEFDGSFVDGRYVVDAADRTSLSLLSVPTTKSLLRLEGTITEIGSISRPQVYVGTSPATNVLYYVELVQEVGGRRRTLLSADNGTFMQYDNAQETVPIEPGKIVLELSIGADRIDAHIDTAGAAAAPMMATGTGTITGQGQLYVAYLSIAFDYVVMIDTQ